MNPNRFFIHLNNLINFQLIILVTFLVLLGCTDDKEELISESGSDTFEIVSNKESVKPFEFVLLESDQINFDQEIYIGTISDQSIELIAIENNKLMFIVPDLSPGQANLELVIGEKIANLSFAIEENNVDNVEDVIETELSIPLNEFNSEIEEIKTDASLPNEIKKQLSSAEEMLEAYLLRLNSLSEEEKLNVARFYNANPVFTYDFLNKRDSKTSNVYDCFNLNAERVVYTTISIFAFIEYLPLIVKAGPAGSIAAVVGFVAGVYAAASIISSAHNYLLSKCFLPFEHYLRDGTESSSGAEQGNHLESKSSLILNNNIFKSFSASVLERHLIAADISNGSPIVSNVVEKLNFLISEWSVFKDGVNSIVNNISSWFYDWLGDSTTTYEPLSYEFRAIPETSQIKESQTRTEFISLVGFPSDVQIELAIGSGSVINLKLSTDNSSLPRTVTGRLVYNDGSFITENTIVITIEKTIEIIGTWTLLEYNGTPTNQYIPIVECPQEPSEDDVYSGVTLYGIATFTENSFSADLGRNQVYNYCITNTCASSSFCYDNPNFIPHSGTYQRVGNNEFIITSDDVSGISLIDENTMIITQGGGTKKYVRN